MSSEKNFCEQCGRPLGPEAKFCPACGHQVAAAVAPSPPAEPGGPPRRQSRLPWIVCGVAVVALGGGAAGYYWGKSQEATRPPTVVSVPAPKESGTVAQPKPGPAVGWNPAESSEDEQRKFAALPPPPPVDPQKEFKPLPPPPPMDPGDEDMQPPPSPDSSQDLSTGTSMGPRWPWTSQRPVTRQDMRGLAAADLVLMRNEIYARHGWVFQRADLQNYFGQQSWYRPKGTPENREAANRLAEAEMSALERQNVKTILQYERAEHGGR